MIHQEICVCSERQSRDPETDYAEVERKGGTSGESGKIHAREFSRKCTSVVFRHDPRVAVDHELSPLELRVGTSDKRSLVS